MGPTDAQRATVSKLRQVHGRDVIKAHAPDPKTGNQWVEMTCLAGVWDVYLDPDGFTESAHLRGKLFELSVTKAPPRNALDN